jgi:hypothetical protein
MLMSFPGKDQYSWSYPWSVEAWIGADENEIVHADVIFR